MGDECAARLAQLESDVTTLKDWKRRTTGTVWVVSLVFGTVLGIDLLSLPTRVGKLVAEQAPDLVEAELKRQAPEVKKLEDLVTSAKTNSETIQRYYDGITNKTLTELTVDNLHVQRLFTLDVPKEKELPRDYALPAPKPQISMAVKNGVAYLTFHDGKNADTLRTSDGGQLSIQRAGSVKVIDVVDPRRGRR